MRSCLQCFSKVSLHLALFTLTMVMKRRLQRLASGKFLIHHKLERENCTVKLDFQDNLLRFVESWYAKLPNVRLFLTGNFDFLLFSFSTLALSSGFLWKWTVTSRNKSFLELVFSLKMKLLKFGWECCFVAFGFGFILIWKLFTLFMIKVVTKNSYVSRFQLLSQMCQWVLEVGMVVKVFNLKKLHEKNSIVVNFQYLIYS